MGARLMGYLYRVGVLAHYIAALLFLLSLITSSYIYYKYNLPADQFFQRAAKKLDNSQSPLLRKASVAMAFIATELNEAAKANSYKVTYNHQVVGANNMLSNFQSPLKVENSQQTKHYKRLLNYSNSKLRTVKVNSAEALLKAVNNAQPGDDIVISAGHYEIAQRQVYLSQQGTAQKPIRLRAEVFSEVTIDLDTFEGFVISGDYWIMENLKINGVCQINSQCEHALHIVGAKQLIIRNNEFTNFNSTVKANAIGEIGKRRFPDNILFEHNTVYNETARKTNTSVTLIDVVTGNNWIIRKNFVANNSKHGSDYTSYALFLKGNGNNGLIEKNIIDCQWSLANDGYTRVGISLGGGGTGAKYCREGSCPAEHTGGAIKNNFVVNCSQDVGIYLNKAKNTEVIHNSLVNTLGIDVRFSQSSANIINNITTGKIRSRDGGLMHLQGNSQELEKSAITSPPSVFSLSDTDLCDIARFKFSAAGALGNKCLEKLGIEMLASQDLTH